MPVFLHKNNNSDQLRWVILLLAAAVLLPTVCLLWFMNQAVKNERLAIRQKLIDHYQKKAQTFLIEYPNQYWQGTRDHLASSGALPPQQFFESFAIVGAEKKFAGYVIYDQQGQLAWPVPAHLSPVEPAELKDAWRLEFIQNNPAEAMKQYQVGLDAAKNDFVRYQARLALVRCLTKLARTEEAAELCYQIAYPADKNIQESQVVALILQGRVRLAELYQKSGSEKLFSHLRRILGNSRYNQESEDPLLSAPFPDETRIWMLERLMAIAREAGLAQKLGPEITRAQKTIEAEQLAILTAERYPDFASLKDWPEETFRRLDVNTPLYGIHYSIADKKVLCLMPPETLDSFLRAALADLEDEMVFCRIYDDTGQFAAGPPEMIAGVKVILAGERFFTCDLGQYFPQWKAELYFREGIFSAAGNRQRLIYIWTTVLVIGLMLLVSGLTARSLIRQAKLNKLKNDFVATVTHELKTPLASTRVLVDTLLAGHHQDPQQVREYLQLIDQENTRLGRLIDHFLTFSRMERNKQVFEIVPADPAEIARQAAEAMQTRFQNHCRFTIDIAEHLPTIPADKDAMITVLVNLLDNAYKYSYDNRQIELRVYQQENAVCFAVRDNGIGMTRRVLKKIFNRFYQADSSLSRRAEGAGLGLSIVKYIVDAHHGRITVESKPGHGSTFTVSLFIK